ncbi:transposase [Coleofasciculus sp.]|uniref:transposase n=1 Tax=Coleofasciculus sp. TaxID=3100458 RepID=UPI0039FA48F9
MNFHPDYYHRHSIRLKGYNYAQPGAYFVTLCTYQRHCWFGEIRNGKMGLNQIGKIVAQEWLYSAQLRQEIQLDAWIIMPNHLHGIVIITPSKERNNHPIDPIDKGNNPGFPQFEYTSPTGKQPDTPLSNLPIHRPARSLSSFIAGFKSTVTKRINLMRQSIGTPIWQRNYYEHIIRNQKSLFNIRNYIINNPRRWESDADNPYHDPNYQSMELDLPF